MKSTHHLDFHSKSIYSPNVFLLCHIYHEIQQEFFFFRFMHKFQLMRQDVPNSCCNIYKHVGRSN